MNGDLKNSDVIYVNGFIISHTLSQCNKSRSFNYMDGGVENGDVSGGHCFMKSNTLYEAKKPSS